MSRHNFDTNIPELIRRLGVNLYNDPMAAARELLQNANDACIFAEGLLGASKGRIDVKVAADGSEVKVRDTGIGMTAEDVRQFLSTIASTRKAEIRKQLEHDHFEAARGIAGQFGIGFLSTFILAKHVEVQTRHQSERGSGTIWRSTGDGYYEISESKSTLPKGTSVTLAVKDEFRKTVSTLAVTDALSKHCPFIRTPYYVNESALPVNHELPPWENSQDVSLAENFMRTNFDCRPIIGFHIQSEGPVVFKDTSIPNLRVSGYLAIPDKKVWYRHPRVYTSGLYVGEFSEGLPPWAQFLMGGIECPDLDLTLGRDNVMRNVAWLAARKVVAEKLIGQIVAALSDRRSRLREKWNSVFSVHDEAIMRGALEDRKHGERQFYEAVKDLIPFRIAGRSISIARAVADGMYLEKDGKKILFYHSQGTRDHESAGIQEALLLDEVDIPFIDARNFFERDFIEQYARDINEPSLVPVEQGLGEFLDFECDVVEAKIIEETFNALGFRARLCKFKPEELAAVIAPLSQSDSKKPAGLEKSADPRTEEGRGLILALLGGKVTAEILTPYTLCVNANNALVIELLRYARQHGVDFHIKAAFNQIYFMSVLLFGDRNTQVVAQMAPSLSGLMLSFIRRTADQESELLRVRKMLSEEREKSENSDKGSLQEKLPNSVFLAYSYDDETVKLVSPLKGLLEDRGIEVIDGRVDRVGSLSRQIINRIGQCSMFVGILTPRDKLQASKEYITSTWVMEEKGVATAFGIPILMLVDRVVSKAFFGNLEGDALRIEVAAGQAAWAEAFRNAVNLIAKSMAQPTASKHTAN